MWGNCSLAEDKIKLDPQSLHDALTPECKISPLFFFKRSLIIAFTPKFTPSLMLTDTGKDNSEALVMI